MDDTPDCRRLHKRLCLLAVVLLTACGGGGSNPPPAQGIGPAGGPVTDPSGAGVVVPASAQSANVAIAITPGATGSPALPASVTAAETVFAAGPNPGLGHSLAVRSDGTVWAWGANGDGQLGDGSASASSNSPVLVQGLSVN